MSKAFLALDEMPEDCYHCPLNQDDNNCGGVLQKGYVWQISYTQGERAYYCPLKPFKESMIRFGNDKEYTLLETGDEDEQSDIDSG